MSEANVIATHEGRIGHLLLNRPKALNALDLGMIRSMSDALRNWATNPGVHAVMIEGAGERAFCAGGDIRAIRSHALAGETSHVEEFFATEYALNALIAAYPKPYVALIDGICMGGGIGVSVHGTYRVTTETGMFAMPETAIAMFPDVGATYVLPRLPGAIGVFLGLTGTRLTGADAVHAGIATHFVTKHRLPELRGALIRDGVSALFSRAEILPPFSLAPHRAAIDRSFGEPDIPSIFRALENEGAWGEEMLALLRTMSPSSLHWSLAAIRRGAELSLGQALEHELRLTRRVTGHSDFAEGVRAMVVDKDRQPKWTPARIEEVDEDLIAAMLE